MNFSKYFQFLLLFLFTFLAGISCQKSPDSEIKLLNVSYDASREFYQQYNSLFNQYWKDKTGQAIKIEQSHGGSGKQSRSVIDGLDADVVTLALSLDIDKIAEKGLLDSGWQKRLPNNSSPYTSTIVFLVRKGNPKGIKDWNDLIRDDVKILTPNPKTGGNPRWAYLAAWGTVIKRGGTEEQAKEYVSKLYKNVPVLDTAARGSLTTFAQRGIGDVLLAWENEAFLALQELGKEKFEIVTPAISILAEPSIAVVDSVTNKKGTQKIAQAYLEYLYSEPAQELIAKNFYRPRSTAVQSKYKSEFPQIELFTIDELFGGWKKAQKTHFDEGGVFDQIYTVKK